MGPNTSETKLAARIGLITVVVRDYDEAIRYYTEILGFALRQDTALESGKRWVVVGPDDANPDATAVLLAKAATDRQLARVGDQTGGRVALFLYTDDFAAAHARMKTAGVAFVEEPRHEAYGIVAKFVDLYGNRWDLIQSGPARAKEIGPALAPGEG